MATPGMGWQQPQHGYGGGSATGAGKLGSGSAQAGLGAEHSPDLHFKMSKKIAQLTKVRERPPLPFLSSSRFIYGFFPSLLSIASAEMWLRGGCVSGLVLNPRGRRPGSFPEGRAWSGRRPRGPERGVPGSRGESPGVPQTWRAGTARVGQRPSRDAAAVPVPSSLCQKFPLAQAGSWVCGRWSPIAKLVLAIYAMKIVASVL